jgi:hypothetical protein
MEISGQPHGAVALSQKNCSQYSHKAGLGEVVKGKISVPAGNQTIILLSSRPCCVLSA